MAERRNIEFGVEGGVTLRGWLFVPAAKGPAPALSDTMTVTDLTLAAYERALEPKKLQLISGGHFAPYLDQFPLAVAAATEWFSEHLVNRDARRVTPGRDPQRFRPGQLR
jgi:hypothetical protein